MIYSQSLHNAVKIYYYKIFCCIIFFHCKFYFKNIYDLCLELIDELQEAYTFLSDMPFDADNEKNIKYLAPLCYNSSLKVNSI